MRVKIFLLPALLGLAVLGCAPKGRNVAEITTRAGTTFIVVDPQANYVRICSTGEIDAFKNVAYQGLRINSSEVKAPAQEEQEIPWEKIARIEFGAGSGDLGDFCPGLPDYVAATVHYQDGHTEPHKLLDTTDDGINGLTERGKVVIPLRNVASLKMVPDQKWPWSTAPESHYDVTLEATWSDGKTTELKQPSFHIDGSKHSGDDTLISPFGDYVDDFPAVIGGAEVDLPWRMLKSVDLDLEAQPAKAKLTFTDGHMEEVELPKGDWGELVRTDVTQDVSVTVKRFDVKTQVQAEPKPPEN